MPPKLLDEVQRFLEGRITRPELHDVVHKHLFEHPTDRTAVLTWLSEHVDVRLRSLSVYVGETLDRR